LTYSQAGPLGTFGSDLASEVSVGYLTNPMDCYEFSYLGSLNWNRANESTGPNAVNFQFNIVNAQVGPAYVSPLPGPNGDAIEVG
jgi:hypothetical protein